MYLTMSILLFILAALLCLKVIWNFVVPYDLAIRGSKNDGQDTGGISLSLEVEIALWLLLILISFISRGETWLGNPKNVAVWGFVAIIASYIHFFVGGAIIGWIANKMKKRKL